MTPEQRLDRVETIIEKQNQEIDKQNAGIRDLIVVGRTVLTSIQELHDVQRKDHKTWSAQMKELREAQAATDDKLHILTAIKKVWGSRVTTVFPRQGHYAHDPKILSSHPPADVSIERIGDLLRYDLPALFTAGRRH